MFGLTDTIKKYGPYAVIGYLMMGGSGAPEYRQVDVNAAQYTATQVDKRISSQGLTDLYRQMMPTNLPGLEPFTGNLAAGSMGDFVRNATRYPTQLLNGTAGGNNYGY